MLGFAFLLAAAAVCAAAQGAWADDKIRLAQSGTVTACMMLCNSQAKAILLFSICKTTINHLLPLFWFKRLEAQHVKYPERRLVTFLYFRQ